MIDYYQQLAQILAIEPAVVATVIAVKGSVPREVSAKMIICANQTFYTIGGGAGEAKVIQQAKVVLQTGESQLVEIDLTGAPQRETQGICGGTMQVWLERWQGQQAIDLTQQIVERLKAGRSVMLITPLSESSFPYLKNIIEVNHDNKLVSSDTNTFTEKLQPPPLLLIIGAGHVGEQLAKVACLIGFQIAIQDDRPEWANVERYPQALIFHQSIETTLSQLEHHSQLYVALVTRGYQYDLAALEALLTRSHPCAYLGMIGSKKRVLQVYQAMEQLGISRQTWRSIYAPIGLDIGALTPEEIAVSICAELILVRRGGSGRSLSTEVHQLLGLF